MDILTSFLGRSGYLPHGYCFVWTPGLLWMMVVADALIAAAYFSIPIVLLRFVRNRNDLSLGWILTLFSAFIFACGVTHLMDIWTIWVPDYGLQALTKVVTAALSLATATALWLLMPTALKIPSISTLKSVISQLELEIGKRRSAEDQLLEIQQSLALTLASIGAGFMATDREGRVTRMNAVVEQALGWTEAEAQGQNFWTVLNHEDLPEGHATLNAVDLSIEAGIPADTANHLMAIARDGRRTALEVKLALMHANDGAVRGLAVVIRDMTPLLNAEIEFSRLVAIVAIVESSNDAIISKTLDGQITSWNSAAQSIFGYSAAEAIGQSVYILIPPDREEEEVRVLADLALGNAIPAFDTLRRTKDGRLLEVSVAISPIRDLRGRVIGASKIARDVSLQRRAEAALRSTAAQLRFTLDAAQIGDWEIDLTNLAMQGSVQCARCFGYEAFPSPWNLDALTQHVHPIDKQEVLRCFNLAVIKGNDLRVEFRVVWPGMSIHWISFHGNVIYESGKPVRILGIVIETTQQRLAGEARINTLRLEAENQQMHESNRLKSQFMANMSHELRTPLNAVIGFARLLESGAVPPGSPKYLKFLGNITTSGRHLLQLINDVLDLSKVESGTFEFFAEPVQLQVTVKEVTDVLHATLEGKSIRLTTDVSPELNDLLLDPSRLKQVLYNLISNAIKFTPIGGHVTVRAFAQDPERFRLEVEDTGIGIAPADLSRLFVEFQQLDAGYGKQQEGTGLGLALTRRLIEAQGGRVGVRSTVGVGSVFHIVLNRIHGHDALHAAPDREINPVLPARHLLENDDEQRDKGQPVQALDVAGLKVDGPSSGAEAPSYTQDTAYEGITLDPSSPDQSGLGMLAGICEQGASRDLPVLGVTMAAQTGEAAAFCIANLQCKPMSGEEVMRVMEPIRLQSHQPACVMVIDNDPLARDLMHATLESKGIVAVCIADGRTAVRELALHRPDAIVLDLMMPGFDGFEVLDELRRLPESRDIPVFIWSSAIFTDEEYARLLRSATDILNKGGGTPQAILEQLGRLQPVAVTQLQEKKL